MLRDDRASTELLGMTVVEMSEGHAVVTMPVRGDMLNGHAIVHGGLVFTLADTAFAMACNTEGSVTVSSGADITFYAPSHAGDVLTATAKVRSTRGRTGIYDVEVRNGEGIVAEFRGHSRTVSPEKMRAPGAGMEQTS
ncbi:hydroxyphenylacetyl-CoA thioesterase PaaI [Terrimesophilobacter mesophilus]|uniref:Hydroxyphenylacetyl-CoA thioesterase PaaI n=2 Tax=Terrimesophilobacter mesophilus TaxID=433647 RepID=A0A4R8VDI0_9MICO|nr:hydroxyphenylacetyl-CoA thioesterase PaaI [Terrimesophilobacter mesophilus]